MNRLLGDLGLGWLTVLPAPIMWLVMLASGGAAVLVLSAFAVCGLICAGVTAAFSIVDWATGSWIDARVQGHHWECTVEVLEASLATDEDWCSRMPDGATEVGREQRYHHSEKRFGIKRRVYEDWCTYEHLKWVVADRATLEGDNTRPRWPEAPDDRCERKGCRKPGERKQTLEVVFAPGSGGDTWTCSFDDEDTWRGWRRGTPARLFIGGLTGEPRCNWLSRTGDPPASKPKPARPRRRPRR